ncbi:Coiled-coil domain-containing protein 113 [Eumeta japonica]|uniref:Cilia- and flagella-associated protein 263 n=1 Tax=Eumeta variegata TaxID=151549 RepID=A0A4C1UUU7_EUMVA|nr:Coiled-coil domain-containing protein 113 [Eumeta japonica]
MALDAKSSVSQYSRGSQALDLDDLSDEELLNLVEELKTKIRLLRLENEVLERTIVRLEPSLMAGVQQALNYASKMQTNISISKVSFAKSQPSRTGSESLASQSKLLMSSSRASSRRMSTVKSRATIILGAGPKINIIEKTELVTREMELMVENLESYRRNAERRHGILKAQLEEIGIRVANIESSNEAFTEQVIVEGPDKLTQRIPAEVWVKFMNEWMKSTDELVGKFRLRTATLTIQYGRLKSQVSIKQELSENLKPVDFEKMEIQNSVCRSTIKEKIAALVELKKSTGDANLNLTVHKNMMTEQNLYLSKVLDTTNKRKKRTIELNKEKNSIAVEADRYCGKLKKIRHFVQKYEVPSIMDYVYIKTEMDRLKFNIKMLKNRYHIQVIALASFNKKLKSRPEALSELQARRDRNQELGPERNSELDWGRTRLWNLHRNYEHGRYRHDVAIARSPNMNEDEGTHSMST